MRNSHSLPNSEKYDKRVKIHTRQFFSEEQRRMITVYSVILPEWAEEEHKFVEREKLRTCSTVEVVKCLATLLEVASNET